MNLKKNIVGLLFFLSSICYAQFGNSEVNIVNLNANTEFSEFGVSFFKDNQVIFSSSRMDKRTIRKYVSTENKQKYLDFYIGDISNGQIMNVRKLDEKLNSKYHESSITFSSDFNTAYFNRNVSSKEDGTKIRANKLYKADYKNNKWVVKKVSIDQKMNQFAFPAITPDGKFLYFASNMLGGYGESDIYRVAINSDKTYGTPVLLDEGINTSGKESFIFISDSNEMFFSSDRSGGEGGLDIYMSKIREDGTLTAPVNLNPPYNSDKDDFAFTVNHDNSLAYFSSNREKGKGDDDIYLAAGYQSLEPEVIDEQVVAADETSLKGDEAARLDSKYGEITGISEIVDGKCVINIYPIYFNYNKTTVTKESEFELDKIAAIMKEYPEIIVESGSHTDSRGSRAFNKKLSSQRAKSVTNYIESKGIDTNRIVFKGYGEEELINKCSDNVDCTDEQHEFNRRTEFVILNYSQVKDLYPNICILTTTTAKEQAVKRTIALQKNIPNKNILSSKKTKRKRAIDQLGIVNSNFVLIPDTPIQFKLDSYDLSEESKNSLLRIADFMLKQPGVKLDVRGHTDSRTPFKYGMEITQKRADKVTEFLIKEGINSKRVIPMGYGSSKLLNKCKKEVDCSEEKHLENRRTDFIIKNPEVIRYNNN